MLFRSTIFRTLFICVTVQFFLVESARFAVLIRGESFRGYFERNYQALKERLRCTSVTREIQLAAARSHVSNVVKTLERFGNVDIFLSTVGCAGYDKYGGNVSHFDTLLSIAYDTKLNHLQSSRIVWSNISQEQQRTQTSLLLRGISAIRRNPLTYDFVLILRFDLVFNAPIVAHQGEVEELRRSFVGTSGDWFWSVPYQLLERFENALSDSCELPSSEDPSHAVHLVRCTDEVEKRARELGFRTARKLPCSRSSDPTARAGEAGISTEGCPFPTIVQRIYGPLMQQRRGNSNATSEKCQSPGRRASDACQSLCQRLQMYHQGPPCDGAFLRSALCDAVRNRFPDDSTAVLKYGGPVCSSPLAAVAAAATVSLVSSREEAAQLLRSACSKLASRSGGAGLQAQSPNFNSTELSRVNENNGLGDLLAEFHSTEDAIGVTLAGAAQAKSPVEAAAKMSTVARLQRENNERSRRICIQDERGHI